MFDPTGRARDRAGRIDIRNVRCPCGGVFFDVTIGLAHWMGVKQYECDTCHDRRAKRVPAKRGR
jgi:hypothetical protein